MHPTQYSGVLCNTLSDREAFAKPLEDKAKLKIHPLFLIDFEVLFGIMPWCP
jgi:hypothetical protein